MKYISHKKIPINSTTISNELTLRSIYQVKMKNKLL